MSGQNQPSGFTPQDDNQDYSAEIDAGIETENEKHGKATPGSDNGKGAGSSLKPSPKPWKKVTTGQICDVIRGTSLEPIVKLLESSMNPPLPLQATLPKAIALAGCALCGKKTQENKYDGLLEKGINLARVKIMTVNGQACNAYTLTVGQSGCGKDAGNFPETIAMKRGWYIGSAGSAEGLADILSEGTKFDKSNGYMGISEFSCFLDKRHWMAKASTFLTDAFNRGWFSYAMSKRSGITTERMSNYCYPSIVANIQPEAMAKYANVIDIQTGFLSRFIISRIPDDYDGRPKTIDRSALLTGAENALTSYCSKQGDVWVPDPYLSEVYQTFSVNKAHIKPHWKRLVNEYGPRFAAMLSVSVGDDSSNIEITNKAWHGADLMVQWFYSMGESVLSEVYEDEEEARWERLLKRTYDAIKKHGPIMTSYLSRRLKGTNPLQRKAACEELEMRGRIIENKPSWWIAIKDDE